MMRAFSPRVRLFATKRRKLITPCRSCRERGKPGAQPLRENGLPSARYVINGFQGGIVKSGPHAGLRIESGWPNSGLPWSPG